MGSPTFQYTLSTYCTKLNMATMICYTILVQSRNTTLDLMFSTKLHEYKNPQIKRNLRGIEALDAVWLFF